MSYRQSITAAIVALFVGAPLVAQGVSQDTTAQQVVPRAVTERFLVPILVVERAPVLGVMTANPAAGVHRAPTTAAPLQALSGVEHGSSTAMMIVGGAGLVVGGLIGGRAGTTIMIGGGALGLIGLWNYLN